MALIKAKIVVEETNQVIEVMYNPTELENNYSIEKGEQSAGGSFAKLNRDNLTITLFFDTYEQNSDVRAQTGKIQALMKPTVDKGSSVRLVPPVCALFWGNSEWYRGTISSLTQKFTLFLSSGIPVRAQLTVTFQAYLTPKQELQALGFFNCRKLWSVVSGDRIDLIAHKALGNSQYWHLIAKENNIDDPLSFPEPKDIGRTLIIPDINEM